MTERRKAAVVLTICAEPPHGVIFVERAAHLRNNAGQIGLPGGAVDPSDPSLEAAALRELHEELGVAPERVTLAGALPVIGQRVGTFDVTPFVGVLTARTELRIDPAETAAVFTVPLNAIIEDGAIREGTVRWNGREITSLVFEHGERLVWGLTGRILHTFVDAWHDERNPLRSRIEAALARRL